MDSKACCTEPISDNAVSPHFRTAALRDQVELQKRYFSFKRLSLIGIRHATTMLRDMLTTHNISKPLNSLLFISQLDLLQLWLTLQAGSHIELTGHWLPTSVEKSTLRTINIHYLSYYRIFKVVRFERRMEVFYGYARRSGCMIPKRGRRRTFHTP